MAPSFLSEAGYPGEPVGGGASRIPSYLGGSGAPCKAHAEDCLSAKSAIVANVREFHRQAEGDVREGERRSTGEGRKRWRHGIHC
jgi:hypothetical protein